MTAQKKRCWAEISLDNIEYNYRQMRKRLPEGCRFLGVVKANAYGHGALKVAGLLESIGADYLAVAFIDEAIELRENGIKLPILVLGCTAPEYTAELIKYNITQSVGSVEAGMAYAEAASETGKVLKCHLKIDSGMGRLGFRAQSETNKIAELLDNPWLDFEGAFTHFAVSDINGDKYTEVQYRRFIDTVQELENIWGKKFALVHCANSGAMINYPYTYHNMVRPGIMLYGHYPDKDRGEFTLRPAMALKTRIVHIKDVQPGDTISYGRIWTADKPAKVAVLSVGYADGLSRLLSNKAEFLLNGHRINQIGRICMDMCMADISDVPDTKVGDEVLIFGEDLPIEEHAEKIGTISYEMLCSVSARVPRIYTYRMSE
ncbi:MAG: alanine racemase [Clostridiales bacterium]|nr:alanine racemase [Clostridiales bacterium]